MIRLELGINPKIVKEAAMREGREVRLSVIRRLSGNDCPTTGLPIEPKPMTSRWRCVECPLNKDCGPYNGQQK